MRARNVNDFSGAAIWPEIVYFSLLACSVHLVGLLVDVDSDAINRKLPYLTSRIVTPRQVVLGSLFSLAAAVAILPWLDALVLVFGLLGYSMGLLYVLRPVRLKGRPPLDLLLHMVGYGVLLFSVGWLSQTGEISADTLISSIPYAAAVGFVYILTARIDVVGDAATGTSTIACWGREACEAVAYAILLTSIVSALLLRDIVVLPVAVLAMMLLISSRFLGGLIRYTHVCRVAVLGLALAVCATYPALLIPLAASILLTRLYHTYRLEISYP